MIQLVQLVLVSFLVHPIQAAVHPAKRQNTLTFEDVCGIDAQDCGNGWCCYPGSECIPASLSAPDPLCRDLAVFDSTDVAVSEAPHKLYFCCRVIVRCHPTGVLKTSYLAWKLYSALNYKENT